MSRADSGFKIIDGCWYYFDSNGVNYRKRWYVDADKKRYYFGEDGVMKTGWFSIDSTNASTGVTTTTWYYADASGSCYLNDEFEIDGKTYWFNSGGVNLRKSFRSVGKRRRYYDEDGVLQKDCWFSTTSTTTVTGPEAERIPEEERTTENKTWYYADSDGYIVTRTDQDFDGAEYRINKNGTMVTGWQRDSLGDYVYYGNDGAANVKHFFTLLGKKIFTRYGNQFFTSSGKEFFTSYGKKIFTSSVR